MDLCMGPYVDSTHNRYRSLKLWIVWVIKLRLPHPGSRHRKREAERRNEKTGAVVPPMQPEISQIPFQGDMGLTSSNFVHVLFYVCIVQVASSACFPLACQLDRPSRGPLMTMHVPGCTDRAEVEALFAKERGMARARPSLHRQQSRTPVTRTDCVRDTNMSYGSWARTS